MKVGNSSIFPGVPDELLPQWTAWQLPSGTLERCPHRPALEQFAGIGLTLGVDARDRVATPARLAQLERLQYLVIDGQVIPSGLLDAVGRLTGLLRLELANVRANDLSFIGSLTELESLQYLVFSHGRTQDRSLSALRELPRLQTVVPGSPRWWQPDDVKALEANGVRVEWML